MLKNFSILAVLTVVLLACSSNGALNGMAQLGADFRRAFAQDRNDEPISLENVTLNLTPEREPFNP